MTHTILHGDCIEMLRTLPDESVHCCVTSPPYYGLRNYNVDGQIGLEPTPEEYVAKMVDVCREVRRVLRRDGTFWLNLGDSYAAARGGTHQPAETLAGGVGGRTVDGERVNRDRHDGYNPTRNAAAIGLKHKDLIGIPWSVAFALRADGWWLRQDVIWHKPNPMPSAVTDRCTTAHEYVFLLTKHSRYFYDADAIKQAAKCPNEKRRPVGSEGAWQIDGRKRGANGGGKPYDHDTTKRNMRSVWSIVPRAYKGAHFATMPPRLAETCILAGTSAEGCCAACGAPVVRVTERRRVPTRPGANTKVTGDAMTDGNRDPQRHVTEVRTTGWETTCDCNAGTVPCTVLDPFGGSGTTLAVAASLGRSGIMCELNGDYIKLAEDRIAAEKAKTALFN